MTTATSEINLFHYLEKQLPLVICQCGKRLSLMQMMDGSKIILKRYPACKKCLDSEVVKEEGWSLPTHHPYMPPMFRETKEDLLHPKMAESLDWSPTYTKSGMLLHGTTGIGKSRAAWEWVNRLWLKGVGKDLNLHLEFLSMSDLEAKIQESFNDKEHGETIRSLCEVPLLVLDDLGKERLTPRMATDLFAIIDKRSLNSKVTVITTNYNGNGLVDRFPPQDKETGIALVRRLRDYYVPFGMKETSHENK